MRPTISICIPTYNRAKELDITLRSITSQTIFQNTDKVEIVVLDNCSTDNTMEVCTSYARKFSNKIIYNRNESNIFDRNFEKCLRLGTGEYLKLNNDTIAHKNGSLEFYIQVLESQMSQRKEAIPYFHIKLSSPNKIKTSEELNGFVKSVSIDVTWIANFGIWRENLDAIKDFSRDADKLLVQVDVLFRLSEIGFSFTIIEYNLIEIIEPKSKGGYDYPTVFLDNYTSYLKDYYAKQLISKETLREEESKLLLNYLHYWKIQITLNKSKYNFTLNNYNKKIIAYYSDRPVLLLRYYKKYYWILFKTFCRYKIIEPLQRKHPTLKAI